jgi:hypothetical protein
MRARKDLPLAAYCAAGLIAMMAEDCGPCTQLGIDMAQRLPFKVPLYSTAIGECAIGAHDGLQIGP